MDVHESYYNSRGFIIKRKKRRTHFVEQIVPQWERTGPVEGLPHFQMDFTVMAQGSIADGPGISAIFIDKK